MCVSLSYGIIFAMIASVAYARMMNCEAGDGEGGMVGSGLGGVEVFGIGGAGAAQETRKTISRVKITRYILLKCQTYLTDTFLRTEMESVTVLRISGVAWNASASIPSRTAPTTGGVFKRTNRACGASLWIVSRIGSISIVPPSNMLPVIT